MMYTFCVHSSSSCSISQHGPLHRVGWTKSGGSILPNNLRPPDNKANIIDEIISPKSSGHFIKDRLSDSDETTKISFSDVLSNSGREYPYHVEFLRGRYWARWKHDVETITVELHAATRGYMGFGFSHSGSMQDGDMLIAWVDESGHGYVQSTHHNNK